MGKKKSRSPKRKPTAVRERELPLDELRTEPDFLKYMELLKRFAKKYCVMIVASDTPIGPTTAQETTRALRGLGLRVDLDRKFRCAYAALIDSGQVLFEELKPDRVETKIRVGKSEVELISAGFNFREASESIRINGKDYSLSMRGLNIAVFDKSTGTILDTTNFDTFAEAVPRFFIDAEAQILKKFVKTHPGVSVICARLPAFPPEPVTPGDRFIQKNKILLQVILNNLHQHIFTLNQYFDEAGITEVLSFPRSYLDWNGVRRFEDMHSKYINISGGHRVTAFQPDQFQRTIFLFGPCTVFGFGSDDNRTVASYLQMQCNRHIPGAGIIIQNYGFFLSGAEVKLEDNSKILDALPAKPGDIVMYMPQFVLSNISEFPCINLTQAAERPRDYEVFFDLAPHYTPDGNRLIAEGLFKGLMDLGLLHPSPQAAIDAETLAAVHQPAVEVTQKDLPFESDTYKELAEYKKALADWYDQTFSIAIGSVVMNCNPFTLGHRFLVETALTQCDFLIIFVVQEDKSRFPFEDRLRLVKEGVADLKNVAVLPSGKFVLSSLTFSEYFNKSELQDRIIDTSLDVTVFAREIAPCLHITKRFVGEEPFDAVTRQYNETMRRILPEYGIEFVEVPRKTNVRGGAVISASHVRDLLEKRDFDAIKPLVPESTFHYLMKLSGGIN